MGLCEWAFTCIWILQTDVNIVSQYSWLNNAKCRLIMFEEVVKCLLEDPVQQGGAFPQHFHLKKWRNFFRIDLIDVSVVCMFCASQKSSEWPLCRESFWLIQCLELSVMPLALVMLSHTSLKVPDPKSSEVSKILSSGSGDFLISILWF